MANRITEIEGIEARYAKTLQDSGIGTTDELLKEAGPAQGRKTLADRVGVPPNTLLEWVNRADLMRIKGIGMEYSDLLEEAGVDSTKELAARVPANLQSKMAEINTQKHLVQRTPTPSDVENWVSAAKKLPQMVTH
jgi:predicted flap endonuclease-1-like 5' DNA nuclease